MPLTFTGRHITPTAPCEHPSLLDIAVGLSRAPRFAGQTRRWWSVLDHTLFCDELAQAAPSCPEFRLALLLHDAHEAMTADVPTDFKTDDLRRRQAGLDIAIANAFYPGGFASFDGWHAAVKLFDKRALLAEAHVVGPPATKERITELFGEWYTPDILILKDMLALEQGGVPPRRVTQDAHPAVVEYQRRVLHLL